MDRILSVDLGKRRDSAALIAMDIVPRIQEQGIPLHRLEHYSVVNELHIRYLERPPLGTRYTAVVDSVENFMRMPDNMGRTYLLVDKTGLGDPVVDFIRDRNLAPIGITIVSGNTVTNHDEGYNVPKEFIATSLQTAFKSRRIKISKALPQKQIEQLFHELKNFSAEINHRTKNVTYAAEKEKDHDDYVMATGQAVWFADRLFGRKLNYVTTPEGKTEYNVIDYGLGRKK